MARILALAAALAALAAAGSAMAHAQLVKADPAVGSIVRASPTRLWLRFNQVARLAGTGVELVGPDGKAWALTPLVQDPGDVRAIVAPLPAPLPPGRYSVRWRALSPDAHHSQGQFAFTLAK